MPEVHRGGVSQVPRIARLASPASLARVVIQRRAVRLFRGLAAQRPVTSHDSVSGQNVGMSEGMIELRGVEKSYPQGGGQVFVLRRIDVEIEEGEFVSIMGPSGAGKSTLLHILGHARQRVRRASTTCSASPVHKLGRKQRARAAEAHDRLRVPELPPARRPHGGREPRDAALVPQREEGASARRSWPTRSTASRSWARRTSTRASSPAASSSWWRSRARSSRAPS